MGRIVSESARLVCSGIADVFVGRQPRVCHLECRFLKTESTNNKRHGTNFGRERGLMALLFSPELRLAAACSIWPPSDRRTEAIRQAASGHLDWNFFLRVIVRHGVVGLAYESLKSAGITVPENISHAMSGRTTAVVRQNLALTAEAIRLSRLFAEANVPVLFVKGTTLASLVYGSFTLREGKDLDLFVPFDFLIAATEVVERAGYLRFDPPRSSTDAQLRLLQPLRKDYGYLNDTNGIQIELHWRFVLNPQFLDETTVMTSSRIIPITATIGLRTLGKDDLFAYLCAHGAQHWWYQLKWLADVGALLAGAPNDGVEQLYRAAKKRRVERAAAQAILLCHRILGTEVPDQLLTRFKASPTLRWLEATALKAMSAGKGELEPRQVLFGTTRGSFSTFFLRNDWRYWLAELKIHLICQADVLTVALPKSLHSLYPVLRLPLWLWRHTREKITR